MAYGDYPDHDSWAGIPENPGSSIRGDFGHLKDRCPVEGCPHWRHAFYAVCWECRETGNYHDFRFNVKNCRRCGCSLADSIERLGCKRG